MAKNNGIKYNRWYSFDKHPKRDTWGIVGETDMGYLFELGFNEDGKWVRADLAPNGKVYFIPMDMHFNRWKIVKQ